MKRNVLFGTVLSAALAIGVSAQTTPPSSQQEARPDSQNPVTVTGCLQNADAAGGATSGTSGSAGAGSATGSGSTGSTAAQAGGTSRQGQFMLNNAKVTPAAGASGGTGTGTSGTSGTSGAGTSTLGNKFVLSGGDQTELKKYLNSQVEIRGTIQPAMSKGSAAGGAATGGSSAQSGMSDVARLRVTSVKQLAPTCPAN